jgi:hypothetical protein
MTAKRKSHTTIWLPTTLRATSVSEWSIWMESESPALPGVFKPSVWYPRSDDGSQQIDLPRYRNREEFLAAQPKERSWRGGLPLWHRDTIFPDDVDRLAEQSFDVLVTHEAPSSHRHGFAVIDELAASGRREADRAWASPRLLHRRPYPTVSRCAGLVSPKFGRYRAMVADGSLRTAKKSLPAK